MNKWINKRSIILLLLQIFGLFAPLAYANKLVIVIDDIGYRIKEDNAIYTLPKEVNVAIIPSAPYATARANKAKEQGREILIHLPMQPKVKQPIEAGALLVGMGESEVSELIHQAQQQVPYAIALNNHMGSKATADKTTMQHLMKALSQQGLGFLDSKTAGDSVAYQTAKAYGLNALERHIFLDNSDVFADVQRQFQHAVQYARKHGIAIMIGHPRKHSIAVLEQGIANLPADIQLASLSSLWKTENVEPVKPFIMLFEIEPALTSKAPYRAVPLLRGIPQE
ncbi:divergent polysaccharide deacetylase family protein [Glaesserella parasuis]|uniref:divergent polysaccharide deacetylase family protein n=1 Tax=Glaesserella parasuis TaxID=738 RepID=UPI0013277E5D|nr:divergent polysaccharide deacetylase family protein [Glaesserella parasuis]MCT8812696.1 divergent polysaccharide deacetylase family protein [Glaesserella parasuis]MCT8844053.1 divergent polysaccharide deacetylase family protein [Glaesserella parasuis]MDE3954103.1 divergent polysaccharide deacetylase family protein [Glaesserella parasuis]MDE3965882.1 divergent polysaccharide deacetylase family protein [Glaesserella parasuis]MDE3979593.1 divergent polysaccharide deacetylase family protein [Gl